MKFPTLFLWFVFVNGHDDERLPNKCEGKTKEDQIALKDIFFDTLLGPPVSLTTPPHNVVVSFVCVFAPTCQCAS